MVGKNLMKHHYLEKKTSTVTKIWKVLLMQITRMQKESGNILKKKKNLGGYHDLYV